MEHFDFVIYLHSSLVTRYAQSAAPNPDEWESRLKYRNLTRGGGFGPEIKMDFSPASKYVKDIERIYDDSLLVFYNNFGGNVIGCLWKPNRTHSRNLKAYLGYSSKPTEISDVS